MGGRSDGLAEAIESCQGGCTDLSMKSENEDMRIALES